MALGTTIGCVTTDLSPKWCRNQRWNEHWVYNNWSACEILQQMHFDRTWALKHLLYMRNITNTALGTNIGFVTTALHMKYSENRIRNKHRGCNHWFTYEIMQKLHWVWTWSLQPLIYMRNTAEIVLETNIWFVPTDLHTKYCRFA